MSDVPVAPEDPRNAFINASVWHGSLDGALAILTAHPEVGSSDIHTAAILGDDRAVARFIAQAPANATAKGGPRNWDALTHLCFSKFLRLDGARSEGFLKPPQLCSMPAPIPTLASMKTITSPNQNGNVRSTAPPASLTIPS